MASPVGKHPHLRRSRAIKVKSGRVVSKDLETLQKEQAAVEEQALQIVDIPVEEQVLQTDEVTVEVKNLKVADRIRAFDTLSRPEEVDMERAKSRGKPAVKGSGISRSDQNKASSTQRLQREGTKPAPTGSSNRYQDTNDFFAFKKLNEKLEAKSKPTPAVASKRYQDTNNFFAFKNLNDKLEAKAKSTAAVTSKCYKDTNDFSAFKKLDEKLKNEALKAKRSPAVSTKPGGIVSSKRRPPVSPKPKLPQTKSAKERSLKVPRSSGSLGKKEDITRSRSTPAPGESTSASGVRVRKTKDSGYGSHNNLLSDSKRNAKLNQSKRTGVCKSIENLQDGDYVDDSQRRLYVTCIGEDQAGHVPCYDREGGEAMDDDDKDDSDGYNAWGLASTHIYDSVTLKQDQDFSDMSDYDDSDEFDDFTDTEEEYESCSEEGDSEVLEELRRDRLYCIVEELKDTEVNYVNKLQLLTEAKVCAEQVMKEEANLLFPYIDEIYKLHLEDYLPQIKYRVKNWREFRCIGDIMKRLAPFLKMYTDYVKDFERANRVVETWMSKSPTFRNRIQQLCEKYAQKFSWVKLDLKAHMLEPVQRVPRYKLLLADYLKRFPADSNPEEARNIQDALNLVSEAAQHYEKSINQKTEFGKLMMLNGLIDSAVSLLGDRSLVKQGPIHKYSLRTDKLDPRYLFLLSDVLVVCKETQLKISGVKYKARQVLMLNDMQVLEGSKLDHELAFVVQTKEKVLELVAETIEDKIDWLQMLWKTIGNTSRQSSRANSVKSQTSEVEEKEKEEGNHHPALGQIAPLWVKNNEVTMCMVCANDFSTFLRRHHCRACGSVVCCKCSPNTWRLEYAIESEQRVCDPCYTRLQEGQKTGIPYTSTLRAASKMKKRCWQLFIESGYVQLSSNEGRTWNRVFCAIHEGGMLYFYKASQNPKPMWYSDLENAIVCTDILGETIVLRVTLARGDSHLIKGVFKEQSGEELWRWAESFEKGIKEASCRQSKIFTESAEAKTGGNALKSSLPAPDVPPRPDLSGEEENPYELYEFVASPVKPGEEMIYDESLIDSSFEEEEFENEYSDVNDSGRIILNESNC